MTPLLNHRAALDAGQHSGCIFGIISPAQVSASAEPMRHLTNYWAAAVFWGVLLLVCALWGADRWMLGWIGLAAAGDILKVFSLGGLSSARELDGIIAGSTDNWNDVKVKGVILITTDFEHLDEIRVDNHMIEFKVPIKTVQRTGASRLAQETNRTSSTAGSRR